MYQLLVVFRWGSLLPAALLLLTGDNTAPLVAFSSALVVTLLVTVFSQSLNQLLLDVPAVLLLDMSVSATLLYLSGGHVSPFYLYTLSPLLSGAFFFRVRGGLLASLAFTPLFVAVAWLAPGSEPGLALFISELAGIWLIPLVFGYASQLLNRVETTQHDLQLHNDALTTAHRQLRIVHDLTLMLQAAPDVTTVQRQVLRAVVGELGFPHAAVGLVSARNGRLGEWLSTSNRLAQLGIGAEHPIAAIDAPALSLLAEHGPLIQALLDHETRILPPGEALSTLPALNQWLGERHGTAILPLTLRGNPVGVLVVALREGETTIDDQQRAVLTMAAGQAAVALGTTILCIDRAQQLAVAQERGRIARDMHDTIAQGLFGLSFTLEACQRLLPGNPDLVRTELQSMKAVANELRRQTRYMIQNLWPSALSLAQFQDELRAHVDTCTRPGSFRVQFESSGDFSTLPPAIRRTLFRIAQEALSNSARHSGTETATVKIEVAEEHVSVEVSDRGRGFDTGELNPAAVEGDEGHFGLKGIQARINKLGGALKIVSQPGEGTMVRVAVPLEPAEAVA